MLGVGGACGPQSERDVATQRSHGTVRMASLRHVRARGEAGRDIATTGMGAVAIFDESGALQRVLIDGSELAAPWGIALAPASLGSLAATCWWAISAL